MASPEIETLANLAAQLGAPSNKENLASIANLLVREDDDDCDFSSFPSLSLEESPGNYHTGNFTNRGDVECHVESLLSRPILFGKQDDDDRSGLVDPESDSLDEFLVDLLEEVPKLMTANFCTSFATLMNSRLRAYTTFLARHALSLARSSKTNQQMEGVIGIEHKLETMLGIGSQVSTGSVSSEFTIDQDKLAETLPTDGDDEAYQVSLPLKMKISVNIVLPHVKEADGNELMKVSFQTTGKICGIFAKTSAGSTEPPLLRVAEVSLNMHELLRAMAEQASKVISCIVEMTNASHAVPLPSTADLAKADTTPTGPSIVAPDAGEERTKRKADDGDDDAIVALSAEKCANIVDCVIGALDDELLTPRTVKKVKVFHPSHAIGA